MLQVDRQQKTAIAHGPALTLAADLPRHPAEALAARIAKFPDGVIRTFSATGDHRCQTFKQLWRRSGVIAGGLIARAIEPKRPIVLLIEDAVDFVPAFWACLRAGFLAVPLQSAAEQAAHERDDGVFAGTLARLGMPLVLASGKFEKDATRIVSGGVPVVALTQVEAQNGCSSEIASACDPTCLLPTSGSTGRLKVAALSPAATLYRNFSADQPSPSDHHLMVTAPLDAIGSHSLLFLRYAELTHVPLSILRRTPSAALDAVEQLGITAAMFTNSLARMIVEDAGGTHRNLASLRHVGLGGEAITVGVTNELGRFLARNGASPNVIRAGYGTTETSLLTSGAAPPEFSGSDSERVRLGTCTPGTSLRIVDDADAVLREGEVGEVQVRCPQKMFSGYWGEADASRTSFTDDGWWRTGDIGELTDGELTLHGRSKEVLVLHGRKYSLLDIDAEINGVLPAGDRAFACAIHPPDQAHERLAVAFVAGNDSTGRRAVLAETIRAAVTRRFGVLPSPIMAVAPEDLPVTASGKIRRSELARRIQSGLFGKSAERPAPSVAVKPAAAGKVRERLAQLWREVMNLDGELDWHANFFDLGGDSLRAVTLHALIADQFGQEISAEKFFAEPTLANLLRLVGTNDKPAVASGSAAERWPLPEPLRNKLLLEVETWPGQRPTGSRLIAALNASGSRTPLFWFFQMGFEFSQLAKSLNSDQPLYGLRSGHDLIADHEDEVQALALRYVAEIEQVAPHGPLFVGGNCAGSYLATAVAQHLSRRRRDIPLLILMETGVIAPQAYRGPVLLLHGRDSEIGNPFKRNHDPEALWRRFYGAYEVAEVPGSYGRMFDEANVAAVAATIAGCMAKAQAQAPRILPNSARRARLSADGITPVMGEGERRTLNVRVCNTSEIAWPATEVSGIELASRWHDRAGAIVRWIDGRVPLPEVMPGCEVEALLPIAAPPLTGTFELVIDLIDEGNAWFDLADSERVRARVRVGPRFLPVRLWRQATQSAAAALKKAIISAR